MSKVALRVYNREIEILIDQGHIDEAIAHCQHILKTYPKHLETYRALGNAYLEARRYSDAADIFQRVLTSVPDDFVSHLGMSIVYDEQKNLDQAIWHMERAYEANPSNGGVQAELRRLYGRRDGLEPPKIQLTRGALAKMYIRGSQYGQAIQEIKTVLQDDKERLDLKVLMAQAYFRSGKKLEASEVCTEILKVSPYCFDANRILVEILPGTSLASNVDTYKKRLQQLDPYIALVTGSTFDVTSVQDAAVTIERLEWDPTMASAPAAWQSDESAAPAAEETPQEDIPDWMKSSGWGPSSGEFQEGPVDFDESPAAEAAGELAAAEIPDWLKAMAPPGAAAEQASKEGGKEEDADLDWLSGISAAAGSAALGVAAAADQPATEESAPVTGDVPDWLSGLGEQQPAAQESTPVADDNADWLSGLGAESAQPVAEESAPIAGDVPDWLSGLGEPQPAAQESAPVADDNADWLSGLGAESAQPVAEESAPIAGDVPDWLSGLGEQQPAAQESAPVADDNADWLSGLGAESAEPAAEESAPVTGDVPDWLSGLGEQQPAAQESAPVADDNANWLAGLGAESAQPAAEESAPVADDNADWLSGLGAESAQPAAEESAPVAGDVPDWLSGLGEQQSAAQESAPVADDNSDWLSGLGAESAQPAAEESAPVTGDVPDWLSGLGEQQPAAQESAPVADDNSDWLAGLGVESAEPAAEESAPVAGDVPDWLSGLGEQQPAAQESAPVADDNTDWLAGLGAESAQPAAEESAPVAGDVPDWLSGLGEQQPAAQESAPVADDNTDWLAGLGAESAEPAAEESAPVAGDVPDWLSGLGEQQPAAQESAPVADDNADWLSGLGAESAEPVAEESAPVTGDVPDWLSGLGEQQPAAQESAPVADDNADWMAGLGAAAGVAALAAAGQEPVAEEPAPVSDVQPELAPREGLDGEPLSALISGPGTTESEQDEAFKWLEMLAAGQGAKPEELLTKPEERLDQAPDWVDGVDEAAPAAAAPVQAPQFVPEPPIEVESEPALTELSAPVTAPGTSELEQDDAFKWLESLAAGQGAKPEELLTKPEERLEQAPGWVGEVENPPTVLSAPVTAPGTSESDQDESFKWLENLAAGQGAKPEELLTKPEERLEHSPEWLSEAEGEPEIPAATLEEPVVSAEPVAELVEEPLPLEEPVAESPAQPLPPVVRVDEEGNPLGELSAPVTAPGTSEDEQDAAFKWLEMLAAGQGAKPEELLTKPEERLDQSPEWVAEVTSQPEPEPVQVEPLQFEPEAELTEVEPLQFEPEPEPAEVEPLRFEPEAEPAEVEPLRFEPEPEPAAEAPVFPVEEPAPAAESVEEVSLSEPVLDWFASDEPQSEQPEMQVFEQTVEAVEPVSSADLDKMGVTEWLKTLEDEESLPQPAGPAVEALQPHLEEDLPDWLKDEKADELPPEPMPVSGWIPAEEAAPVSEPVAETPQPAAPVAETPIQPSVVSAPPPAPVAETRPAPPPAPRPALRQTGMLGGDKDAMLLQRSRLLLEKANLESAMSEYSRLIKKGKYMEEIIFDLKEATYTHPVDVIVWQTLGDAYMRTNRLQEALDAYTKAEELLR